MEGLGVAASVIAVVDISIKVASLCVQYAKDVKNAAASIERLQKEVISLKGVADAIQALLSSPNGLKLEKSQRLKDDLDKSLGQLKSLERRLSPRTSRKAMSRMGLHALKWPFQSKEMDDLVERLRRHAETINRTLQVEQTIDQKTVLSRLPIAVGASFDSRAEEHNPTCLQDTRVDLLRQIRGWANDPCGKPLFWLNGMAGTGKSTISRTVARSFATSGYLGGSFFFKRGETDRGTISKFFTTPAIAPHIKAAIETDPNITGKAARDQFDKLIMQPLRNMPLGARRLSTLVLVIDALDECERDEDVKLMIHLLSCAKDLQFPKLRILVELNSEIGACDRITDDLRAATYALREIACPEIPIVICARHAKIVPWPRVSPLRAGSMQYSV
ncbi:hypothetical protein BGZ63DRAFT_412496 [Mariannaea sp. PMI_226]|nr:hypothetical protein BGZ63DRAFT_412496 [Mariannaea sp. PMI_226]